MLCIYYCAPDMNYIDEAPQIKIDYREEDPTLEKFIEVHNNQTIYITIAEDFNLFNKPDTLRRFQNLKQYKNWVLQIPISMISTIKENESSIIIDDIKFDAIKDSCNKYMFTDVVGSWEVLQFILSLHPAEVYITNILGFSFDRLYTVCNNAEVGIRVTANVAQAAWDGIEPMKKFFIRPEDVDFYETYCSGIEFSGKDKSIQEVMYKIYKRQYWYGDLKEIIIGLDQSLDSRQLPLDFGKWRANCGKRCITGGKCNLCKAILHFAENMDKTETLIVPKVKQKL